MGTETCDQSHDIKFLLTEEPMTVPQCQEISHIFHSLWS